MCMGDQVELEAFVEAFHACKLKAEAWTFGVLVHHCHIKMQSYSHFFKQIHCCKVNQNQIKSPNCLTCGDAGVYPTVSARRLGKHP